jgi:hypothetical protein
MINRNEPRARRWLLVLSVVVVAIAFAIVATAGDEQSSSPPPPAPTITTAVDGPDADTKRDDPLVLGPAAQAELAEATEATDRPGDEYRELSDPLRESFDRGVVGKLDGPLAAPEIEGCRTRFVGNFSTRNRTRPTVIVWHQTVSRERAWASQDALTAMANRRSSGVSWHLLVGRSEGRCTYTVPLTMKAWTQGNANPFSVGIEVEAFGDEPSYVAGAGERRLLDVTRQVARQFGIPLRRGRVENCRPTRSGIVEHADLGACGGGHVDAASVAYQRGKRPELAGWDTDRLIAKLADRPTDVDRVTCRKLNAWRNAGRPRGGQWEKNSVRRRRALASRRVTCTSRGPVKR